MDGRLICGAAGVGKSSVARPLALRYGVPLTEVDDIVTALAAVTTPEQQPLLHYWATHPETRSWPPDRIADLHFAVAESLRPGLRAVIADHIEFRAPVVMEGDYLLPDLAREFGDEVRAVVLDEPDVHRIAANFGDREGTHQLQRAHVSGLVGARLRARAEGVAIVPAQPWADSVDRVDSALLSIVD